jgi:hypothetical protein
MPLYFVPSYINLNHCIKKEFKEKKKLILYSSDFHLMNKKKNICRKKGNVILFPSHSNIEETRDFNFNLKSTYNTLNGYKAPVSPLPYKEQLTGALNNNRFML